MFDNEKFLKLLKEQLLQKQKNQTWQQRKRDLCKARGKDNPYVTWEDVYKVHGRKMYVRIARAHKNQSPKRGEIILRDGTLALAYYHYRELARKFLEVK